MKHFQPPPEPPAPPQEPPNAVPAPPAVPPNRRQCPHCGALYPMAGGDCVVCGGQAKKDKPASTARPDWKERLTDPAGMRKGRRATVLVSLLLVAVLTLSGAGVGLYEYLSYQSLVSLYKVQGSLVYRQGTELKIALPQLEEPLLIGDYGQDTVPVSADESYDGRFLAYLGQQSPDSSAGAWGGDLYLLDLIQLDEQPEEAVGRFLHSGVVAFQFSSRRDRLALLTAEGDLLLCDYSGLNALVARPRLPGLELLDTGVKGIALFEGRTLIYYKGDRADAGTWEENHADETGRPMDLYYTRIDEEPVPPTLVDTGIYRLESVGSGMERAIYTKRTRSAPLPLYDVYLYQYRSGEATLLASDVRHVVDANATRGMAFVLTPGEETLSFRDLFDDDLQEPDLLLTEPDPQEYGIFDEYGEEVAGLESEELELLFQRFDADYDAWQLKLQRDRLRRYLRDEVRGFVQQTYLSFHLQLADNGRLTTLAEGIYNWKDDPARTTAGSLNDGYVFFTRGDRESVERRLFSELSEADIDALLSSEFDVLDFLSRNMPVRLSYGTTAGDTADIFTESGSRYLTNLQMTVGMEGLYFTSSDYSTGAGTLYYVDVGANMAERVIHVDEDVTGLVGLGSGNSAGLFYQKTTRGAAPSLDLCHAVRSQSGVVSSGADPIVDARLAGDNSVVLFYRVAEHSANRRLYLYDGEEHYIAQSVADCIFYSPGRMLLLQSNSRGILSLSLYQNGEIAELDDGIGGYRSFEHQ